MKKLFKVTRVPFNLIDDDAKAFGRARNVLENRLNTRLSAVQVIRIVLAEWLKEA
jgi:hypothetical protein